jgi:hypothetical protein
MNTKKRHALIFALALLGGAALVAMTWAAPGNAPLAPGGAPAVVSYQGEVRVGGTPYTGNGYFKFAVINAAGNASYWSNNGTSTGGGEPTAAVQLAVSDGLFSVLLGDTALGGMTQALTADVFSQPNRYLRVWFSSDNITFNQLTPDTRISAVPYALQAQEAADADTVDGLHASELGADYQNVVVVAKSGGDYTSVQAAIDSISDAAADNPYLVWVAPGVYNETVTMKPYVHLQGAGQEATIITSTASGSAWPPTQATLVLASDTSLRDLMVGNGGAGDSNAALLATAGMTRTLAADVTARALGGGVSNHAIVLTGSGTGVTLQQVSALAENGSAYNLGLVNMSGAAAVLRGGSFTARGGEYGWGIFTRGSGTTLEADSVTALGENGSDFNVGLYNYYSATAVLRSGVFTGRGGNQTGGVSNAFTSTMTAEDITGLAENGSDNCGLGNYNGAAMTVRGAAVTARGGLNNYALANEFNVTLDAESVTALAENGSVANHGFWNVNNAKATVRGGSFTGRGGPEAWGIHSSASGTTLEAEGVTALGKDGSGNNYGLNNSDQAVAMLRGGSFTGRGGTYAYGISTSGSSTTLEAESVTALAEDGSSANHGLFNFSEAAATLHGGAFTGRGGFHTYGISNNGNATLVEAEGVTALGENGSSGNYGLYNDSSATATADSSQFTGSSNGLYLDSGTVRLGVSQLDGGATRTSGTLTCFRVYDGNYAAYTCP